jgi:hypothetical protein
MSLIFNKASSLVTILFYTLFKLLKTLKIKIRSSQAATNKVQLLRCEYREKVRDIEPKNLVLLDEMGLLLGLMRTHARSEKGCVRLPMVTKVT